MSKIWKKDHRTCRLVPLYLLPKLGNKSTKQPPPQPNCSNHPRCFVCLVTTFNVCILYDHWFFLCLYHHWFTLGFPINSVRKLYLAIAYTFALLLGLWVWTIVEKQRVRKVSKFANELGNTYKPRRRKSIYAYLCKNYAYTG